MCCAELIAKYVLFIVNFGGSLVGLAVMALGIVGLVWLRDVSDVLPVVSILTISLLVLGIIVFLVSFLGCCGAIQESQCMLVSYVVALGILVALKIWLSVIINREFNSIQSTVDGWLDRAFQENNLSHSYQLLEHSFSCCGTTGANSYTAISQPIPFTCCNTIWTEDPEGLEVCTIDNSFEGCGGDSECSETSVGSAIVAVLLVIIAVEVIGMVLASFLIYSVRQKRTKTI